MKTRLTNRWTDGAWNPILDLARASAGGENRTITDDEQWQLQIPMTLDEPRRILVNSTSDLFHREVPFEWAKMVFAVMRFCPQHTFQITTKYPERMSQFLRGTTPCHNEWDLAIDLAKSALGHDEYFRRHNLIDCEQSYIPRNIWLGTSVEDQQTADQRIMHLLHCPAALRFVIYAPALGPVLLPTNIDVGRYLSDWERRDLGFPRVDIGRCVPKKGPRRIHWVIVTGRSGAQTRSFNTDWARMAIAQAKAARIPCFVDRPSDCPRRERLAISRTQGSDLEEWPDDLRVTEFPEETFLQEEWRACDV